MWSICGVHDQGWNERPVFGKIRYMIESGLKRKFDISVYCKQFKPPTPTDQLHQTGESKKKKLGEPSSSKKD